MRYRIILPVFSIVLGVVAFRIGDWQVRNLQVSAQRGASEGIPVEAAAARYPHYAINAPAWAVLGEKREMRWSPSTYWTGRDLRYLLAVMLMWYVVGYHIDKRVGNKRRPKEWVNQIVALAYLGCGFLVFHSIYGDFVPLSAYGVTLPNMHAFWFTAAVLLWGCGLLLNGSRMLLRREPPYPA